MREGVLKKRNEFGMKQTRLFILFRFGIIKYFKNWTLHRGTIVLKKTDTIRRVGKNAFDIVTANRTWHLFDEGQGLLDAWI